MLPLKIKESSNIPLHLAKFLVDAKILLLALARKSFQHDRSEEKVFITLKMDEESSATGK